MKFYSAHPIRYIVWGSLVASHRNWPWLTWQSWKGWALGSLKDADGRNLWMVSSKSNHREGSCSGETVWFAQITSCVHPFARWGRDHLMDWRWVIPQKKSRVLLPKVRRTDEGQANPQQCCRERYHPCSLQMKDRFPWVSKSQSYL